MIVPPPGFQPIGQALQIVAIFTVLALVIGGALAGWEMMRGLPPMVP
jgi:hypothetical protein